MMQRSQFYAAVLNFTEHSSLLTCVLLKERRRLCEEMMYSGTKKRIRTDIRLTRRSSTVEDGNDQLFWERDIFVCFVNKQQRGEEGGWLECDDLRAKKRKKLSLLSQMRMSRRIQPLFVNRTVIGLRYLYIYLTWLSTTNSSLVTRWISVKINTQWIIVWLMNLRLLGKSLSTNQTPSPILSSYAFCRARQLCCYFSDDFFVKVTVPRRTDSKRLHIWLAHEQ